jgi:hypothetical protein
LLVLGTVKGLTSKVKFRFLLNFAFEASTHGSSPQEERVQKISHATMAIVVFADRFRTVSRRKANSEILEAGLILIVAISIISVAPASFRDGTEIVREHTLPLLLAALANRAVHLRTQLYAADQKAPR